MDVTHVRFVGTPSTRSRVGRDVASPRAGALLTRRPSPLPAAVPVGLPSVVLAHSGLNPADYREGPLSRRTPACLRLLRTGSESGALERVLTTPAMVPAALSTYLIGFSGFFRDPDVFRTLETRILPRLRSLPRPVRVLSVGCSTGQELYSVAMLLEEQGRLDDAQLVGLDCRPDALADAARGRFSLSALDGLDAGRRERFLVPSGDDWSITPRLRARTEWLEQDATQSCPEGPWDLILCRNLFIYLQTATADTMLGRMVQHLADDGVLIVGKAERPPSHLPLTLVGRCVYTKGRA